MEVGAICCLYIYLYRLSSTCTVLYNVGEVKVLLFLILINQGLTISLVTFFLVLT